MLRFGESSLDFRLRCWVRMEDWVSVASDLHVSINRELKTAGITIPFPQRDLHVRSGAGVPVGGPAEGDGVAVASGDGADEALDPSDVVDR